MTDNQNAPFTRREALGIAAGAGITSLAGCSGGNPSGGGSGSSANGGSGGTEKRLDFRWARKPTTIQFNKFNSANYAISYQDVVRSVLARAYSDGTIQPILLEEQTVDGKTLTLKFPKDRTWWNGDPLTAKDYHVQIEIERLLDPEASKFVTNELVDKYTIKRKFKNDVAPKLMKAESAESFVTTPESVYRPWLQKLQDATTQSERSDVGTKLSQMKIPTKEFMEKGLGSALYQLDQFNAAESILKKFEDHPNAGQTDIETVRMLPRSSGSGLLSSNKLDFTVKGFLPNSQNVPENLENQNKFPYFRTQKFTFNWQNEHLSKRPVRRAIAHAVDQNVLVSVATDGKLEGEPTQVQTGLRESIHDRFLGKGWTDQLIKYPVGGDTKGAAKLMRGAGYSKQGGTWADKNGQPVEFDILASSVQPFQIGAAQVFADQLESFGIGTNIQSVGNNYYQKLMEYEHDIAWIWHVAKALWHPLSYFSNDFYGVLVGDPSSDEEVSRIGMPFEQTIPQKVGAKQVQGGGQTVRPAELMQQLPVANSAEKVQSLTRKLVWWFNFQLPDLVYLQEFSGYWGDVGSFSFPQPKEHSLNTNRPGQYALKEGLIKQRG